MKKNQLCRLRTLGIVFLIIGVSYTSAVSVEIKTINNEKNEECDCNEINPTDIKYLKMQLNRVNIYGKLFMVLTKHNPELKEISKEIVNEINSLNFQIEKLTNQPFPIICDIFLKLSNHLATVESYFFDWLKSSEENSLEWIIAFLSYEIVFEPIFGPMILFVIYGWDIFQCSG